MQAAPLACNNNMDAVSSPAYLVSMSFRLSSRKLYLLMPTLQEGKVSRARSRPGHMIERRQLWYT